MEKNGLQVSLIITTYNWPRALDLVLQSARRQTVMPHEVIVADDGSGEETREVIASYQKLLPVPLLHSWQEDRGFRLAKSRNKAIAKVSGNYVILIDGDILLERHFIEDHCRFARQGFFVQGTRVLLRKELTDEILRSGRPSIGMLTSGVENRKNVLRSSLLAKLFSYRSARLNGIKTCNYAFWKGDAKRINGFNEKFVGWGREDSEFTARLLNTGVKRQNVRFSALGYHLYHTMNTRNRLAVNDMILSETIRQKSVWCELGLNQYLIKT